MCVEGEWSHSVLYSFALGVSDHIMHSEVSGTVQQRDQIVLVRKLKHTTIRWHILGLAEGTLSLIHI